MPAFYTPPAGLTLDDLAERIAARVVDMYSSIEAELLALVARRILRQLPADPDLDDQIAVVRALQADARALLGRIPPDLAVQIVQIAIEEGTAAAAGQLALHAGLPRTTSITPSAASTLAMIAADLGSAFDGVHLRILRYPIDAVGRFIGTDVYQQTIARFAPLRMLGTMTTDEVRKRALAGFLEQGVTGFTDRLGRQWRIGSYTEMATRAATARAFVEAETHRYLQHGRGLISILGNNDACAHCARWFGKVLSIDGTPAGTYEYPHPTRDGETVTVIVAATLDEARAQGFMHPNCACSTAAYTPGFSVPTAASHYDPAAEAGRERQRYLERQIRDLKRKIAVAEATDDPARAARLKVRVRERQKEIRDLIAQTGQKRRNDREQVHWADGPSSRPSQPPVVPVVVGPPSQALAAEAARARLEVVDG